VGLRDYALTSVGRSWRWEFASFLIFFFASLIALHRLLITRGIAEKCAVALVFTFGLFLRAVVETFSKSDAFADLALFRIQRHVPLTSRTIIIRNQPFVLIGTFIWSCSPVRRVPDPILSIALSAFQARSTHSNSDTSQAT
jgi:hypothetical protein